MGFIKNLVQVFKVKHEELKSEGVKLQVVENEKLKMFKLDDITHSIINKRSVYTHGYWDYFLPAFYSYKNPSTLMIGLGMGTTAHQLRALFGNRLRLEIVENNTGVVKLARKHNAELERERIIVADGASYLRDTDKKYDIIVLDAYEKAARIPVEFLKEKFVRLAHDRLKKEGVMEINYAMNPMGIMRFGSFKRVLKRFFKVYSVKTDPLGDTQILLCTNGLIKERMLSSVKRIKKNRSTLEIIRAYSSMREI